MTSPLKPRFNSSQLYKLFAIVALPIQVWAFIVSFQNISPVSFQADPWDSIGFGAYVIFYSLLETIFVFLFVFALTLFLPKQINGSLGLAIVVVCFFVVVVWFAFAQTYSVDGSQWPILMLKIFRRLQFLLIWPLFLSLWMFGLVGSALIPLYVTVKYSEVQYALNNLIDRISLLVTFYLLIDVAAIILIAARNFSVR